MATVRKSGNRQLKVLCDCGSKHLITASDDGEMDIETILGGKKKDGEPSPTKVEKKEHDIFDLLGGD
jgi:hypothetical protein